MEENETLSKIEDGSFKIVAYNGFPISSNIQIYLLDDSYGIIDSLFATTEQITAGVVDMASGKVVSKTRTELLVPLSPSKIDNLYATEFIKIVTDFTTASALTYNKIYSDYSIDVKIIGDFTYTIDESLR